MTMEVMGGMDSDSEEVNRFLKDNANILSVPAAGQL